MFISIAKIAYNNTKITNISYIFFQLNFGYYLYAFFKKKYQSLILTQNGTQTISKTKIINICVLKKSLLYSKISKTYSK